MAETDDDQDAAAGLTSVPPWVLRVVRDVAETKTTTRLIESTVNAISNRLGEFVTRTEYDSRHKELKDTLETLKDDRIGPLWDHYQQRVGSEEARRRQETIWRWGIGTALALLTAWALLRQAGYLG